MFSTVFNFARGKHVPTDPSEISEVWLENQRKYFVGKLKSWNKTYVKAYWLSDCLLSDLSV